VTLYLLHIGTGVAAISSMCIDMIQQGIHGTAVAKGARIKGDQSGWAWGLSIAALLFSAAGSTMAIVSDDLEIPAVLLSAGIHDNKRVQLLPCTGRVDEADQHLDYQHQVVIWDFTVVPFRNQRVRIGIGSVVCGFSRGIDVVAAFLD